MNLFEYMTQNPGMTFGLAVIAGGVAVAGMVTFYHVCSDVLAAVRYK